MEEEGEAKEQNRKAKKTKLKKRSRGKSTLIKRIKSRQKARDHKIRVGLGNDV